jgi:hypothetical protein
LLAGLPANILLRLVWCVWKSSTEWKAPWTNQELR